MLAHVEVHSHAHWPHASPTELTAPLGATNQGALTEALHFASCLSVFMSVCSVAQFRHAQLCRVPDATSKVPVRQSRSNRVPSSSSPAAHYSSSTSPASTSAPLHDSDPLTAPHTHLSQRRTRYLRPRARLLPLRPILLLLPDVSCPSHGTHAF